MPREMKRFAVEPISVLRGYSVESHTHPHWIYYMRPRNLLQSFLQDEAASFEDKATWWPVTVQVTRLLNLLVHRGYIERMENKVETTIVYRGYRVYRFWILVSIFFSVIPI